MGTRGMMRYLGNPQRDRGALFPLSRYIQAHAHAEREREREARIYITLCTGSPYPFYPDTLRLSLSPGPVSPEFPSPPYLVERPLPPFFSTFYANARFIARPITYHSE